MLLIWVGLFLEVLILSLVKPLITDFEMVSVFVVLLHSLFTMVVLLSYPSKQKIIFLGAYFCRLAFMFWDLFARRIFILPNSGADSEMFYNQAIDISENISSLFASGIGLYPKLNGLLFSIIGPQRAVAQYVNVLLGLSVVIIVFKILMMVVIDAKVIKKILIIAAFFPNSIIMSAIFLREVFPTFFVAMSLYFFLKWFKTTGYVEMVMTFIMLGIASMFHSGVIGILVGYVFAFLFYKRESDKFIFSSKTLISFVLIVIVFSFGYTYLGDRIFYKFGNVDDITEIYNIANRKHGASAYLTSLQINNPIQLVFYGPLKSLFFLTVPLPMNWRGFMDVFTFFSDSLFYISTIIYYLKNRKKCGNRRQLVSSIVIMIIGSSLIFGVGVSNAGTAIRHRQKLIPLFLILFGLMMDGKWSLNQEKYNNLLHK